MSNEIRHFCNVVIYKDKIIASYSGKNRLTGDSLPSEFIVFDINGNYIQTMETGYKIVGFCLDRQNNRIILHLDDTMQFAYIDLDNI